MGPLRALAVTLVMAVFLLGTAGSYAQEQQDPGSAPVDSIVIEGYPVERERVVGGPTDVTTDLNNSFPKRDSVLPSLLPGKWFKIKEDLYDKTRLKLAFNYQSLLQKSSETLGILDSDYAWGGWFQAEAKWNAFRTGEDYEGSLTATLDWRHDIADGQVPAFYGPFGVGSLWPTDIAFFEWDPAVPVIYWEQWGKKDVVVVRLGKQLAAQSYDFFRFKDARTSFSTTPFSAHTSIPAPAFGQAISFQWWPFKSKSEKYHELYVLGTLNDMNGEPTTVGLDTFFKDRKYFYGLEIGYFWKRQFPADFDHVHLDIFYADERNEPTAPGFPNKAGGGFKLLGSKQRGRLVWFGSYTFNTAEGGGLSLALARHTVGAGVGFLKPAGIRGEISLGLVWMDAFDDVVTPIGPLKNQFGGETYWKILLTPDFWITPGLQFINNPAFNPDAGFVVIPQVKFRLFF